MNKKIKIIDLLCLISNSEEVPKKIKYNNIDYYWCSQCKIYERFEDGSIDLYNDLDNLNDEVEILDDEEDKDIPLIPDDELYEVKDFGIVRNDLLNYNFKVLKEKINQVVKELNRRNNE